jgi:LacI family transcriptional regulator
MSGQQDKPESRRVRPVSIRDVAVASGVSLTTVSLILNNGDARISQPTRERVLAAISRLGYRPNRLAQGLQNRRSHILAILVPHLAHTFADPYFGELISGVYEQATESGYQILLEAAGDTFVGRKKFLDLFDRCFVDGMLFMGSTDEHRFVDQFRDRRRPFVLVNNVRSGIDWVAADYRRAGELAVEHLVGLGHRRIAMILGGSEVETARRLRASFVEHLARRGILLDDDLLEDGLYTEEGGAEAAQRLVERHPGLTAIFTGSDKMAAGAIQRLQALGRRIPHDLSVIGCDDIHHARFVTPSLTTIHLPLFEIGRRACLRVVERLRAQIEPCSEILPVELAFRESTGPVPR